MKFKGNYFDRHYLSLDVPSGRIENRAGTRLIALNEDFLLGFYQALIEETGQAHHVVFETCGKTWGENMATRLKKEISNYYECPLHELPMSLFASLLKALWQRHGWGEIQIDWEQGFSEGIFAVTVYNPAFSSIFAKAECAKTTQIRDDIFTGILKAFFSRWAENDLACYQTQYEVQGEERYSHFILGLPQRLSQVPDLLRSGKTHTEILTRILESGS